MTVVAFDTLKLAEKLHSSGFTRKQATGAAEALSSALAESYTSKLATTEAVETLGRAIDNRFTGVENGISELHQDIKILNENQLVNNSALNAIMNHLGIVKG